MSSDLSALADHRPRAREPSGARVRRATHLLLDTWELLEKLCVLVSAPRTHLLRYHGVLVPHGVVTLCILSSNAWNHEVV